MLCPMKMSQERVRWVCCPRSGVLRRGDLAGPAQNCGADVKQPPMLFPQQVEVVSHYVPKYALHADVRH